MLAPAEPGALPPSPPGRGPLNWGSRAAAVSFLSEKSNADPASLLQKEPLPGRHSSKKQAEPSFKTRTKPTAL